MFYAETADLPLYQGSVEGNSFVSHGAAPTAHSITCDIKGGGEFRRTTPESEKRLPQSPEGDTLHNGLYGDAPPERGTFLRLSYIKG